MLKPSVSVSVVIATHNAQKTIAACLASIRDQNYDQKAIEIIVADGASSDNTLEIAKSYRTKIISIPKEKQNAEYNKAVGIAKAKGEFLLMIDHDNVLPHKNWIQRMVKPIIDNKDIVGVETLRYHYDPKNSLLDRYFALFGAGDPLAYYLGKADRLSFLEDKYNLFGKAVDCGDYFKVTFNKTDIPTLGANGFLIRRNILIDNAQITPDKYFHIDVNVDLIKKGFNTYAFVKDSIIHLTGNKSIYQFLNRRKLFMEQYYMQEFHRKSSARRYSVYTPKDKWKLIIFIIYSLTWVKPLYDSIRGFIKIPDIAWFFHPFLCFTLTAIYGDVIIEAYLRRYLTLLMTKR